MSVAGVVVVVIGAASGVASVGVGGDGSALLVVLGSAGGMTGSLDCARARPVARLNALAMISTSSFHDLCMFMTLVSTHLHANEQVGSFACCPSRRRVALSASVNRACC